MHASRKLQDPCTATVVQWNLRTQKRCVGLRSYDVWLQFWILCQEAVLELPYCDIFMRVTMLARADLEIAHGRWSAWTLVNYLSDTQKAGCGEGVGMTSLLTPTMTSSLLWRHYMPWRHVCHEITIDVTPVFMQRLWCHIGTLMPHWDTNDVLEQRRHLLSRHR